MHKSVLLDECISYLNLTEEKKIVDCTLGYAGHSSRILKEIKRGFLFAFDQDKEAISSSKNILSKIGNNFEIIKSNFVYLKKELNNRKIDKVDGFLFDLGVSSPQLDEDYRGFSFHKDAILDMRMDTDKELSAKKVVNEYSIEELTNIFYKYGEEKYAKSIAKGIINYRENKEIETTLELVEIIKNSVPEKYKRDKHPARKVFQAIRIEVNDELKVFEIALYDALEMLNVNGRICVITFHSLEDKICKRIFSEKTKIKNELKRMPVIPEEFIPKYKLIANTAPTKKELLENTRARSSRVRVIEKIKQ